MVNCGPCSAAYRNLDGRTAVRSRDNPRLTGHAMRIAGIVLLVAAASALPANAQDFISQLFGGAFWKSPDDHSVQQPRSRSSYANRTYCVRLCDGYYWPVNSRLGTQKSAAICESSCQSPAQLYRIPSLGRSTEDMRDLNGKRYGDLPTAFKYRKSYDKSCSCRPAPWSVAERERHQRYSKLQQAGELEGYLAAAPQAQYSTIRTGSTKPVSASRRPAQRRRARSQSRETPVRSRNTDWKKNVLGN